MTLRGQSVEVLEMTLPGPHAESIIYGIEGGFVAACLCRWESAQTHPDEQGAIAELWEHRAVGTPITVTG